MSLDSLRSTLQAAKSQRTIPLPSPWDYERWARAGFVWCQLRREVTVKGERYRLQLTEDGRELLALLDKADAKELPA